MKKYGVFRFVNTMRAETAGIWLAIPTLMPAYNSLKGDYCRVRRIDGDLYFISFKHNGKRYRFMTVLTSSLEFTAERMQRLCSRVLAQATV